MTLDIQLFSTTITCTQYIRKKNRSPRNTATNQHVDNRSTIARITPHKFRRRHPHNYQTHQIISCLVILPCFINAGKSIIRFHPIVPINSNNEIDTTPTCKSNNNGPHDHKTKEIRNMRTYNCKKYTHQRRHGHI